MLCVLCGVCAGLFLPLLGQPETAHAAARGIIENRLGQASPDPATDAIIAEMGGGLRATWTRIVVDWRLAQPQEPPAGYDDAYLANLDAAISKLKAAGVRVILTALWVPKWASDRSLWSSPPPSFENGYQPFYAPDPDHVTDFGKLGGELAKRFAKYGVLYECWNEPNLYAYLYPQTRAGAPDFGLRTYLDMLKSFSRGIKAVQPKATVIAGANTPYGGNNALSTSPQRFAAYLKQHGGAKYFDAYSHHPYQAGGSKNPAPDKPPYNTRNSVTLYNLQQLLRVFPTKPFYLTEYGYCTRDTVNGFIGVSEVRQASYLRKAYAMVARHRQVKALLWFLVKDSGPYDSPSGFFSGLSKYDGSRKLAWFAFAGGNRLSLIAPKTVRRSKQFSLTGKLSNRDGPVAGKNLLLLARSASQTAWKTVVKTSTRSDGTYSFGRLSQQATRSYCVKWLAVTQSVTRKVLTP